MKKVFLFTLSFFLLSFLFVSPVLADLSFEQGLTDWTVEQRSDPWSGTLHEYISSVITDRYSEGVQSVRLGAKIVGDSSDWWNTDQTQTIVWKGPYDLTRGVSISVDMADIQRSEPSSEWWGYWGWGMEADLILSDGTNETRSLLWDYHEENTGLYGPAGLEDNLYSSIVIGADGTQWFRYNVPLTAGMWGGADFGGGPLSGLDLSHVKIGVVYAATNWNSSPQTLWANGLVDNVQIDYLPTVPEIVSPANNSIVSSADLVKIDWTDSTGSHLPLSYQYEAYADAGYSSLIYSSGWLATSEIPTPGTAEGTYYLRVRAKDSEDNLSEWSNGITNLYKIVVANPPTNKDQCKKDGWMTFINPVFKNQGDCVSFVQSSPNAIGNKTK